MLKEEVCCNQSADVELIDMFTDNNKLEENRMHINLHRNITKLQGISWVIESIFLLSQASTL